MNVEIVHCIICGKSLGKFNRYYFDYEELICSECEKIFDERIEKDLNESKIILKTNGKKYN